MPVAAYEGEMATDGVFPPEIFWSAAEFWGRWGSGRRMVAVIRGSDAAEFRGPGHPPPRFLVEPPTGRNGYGLVANYPGEGR